MTGMVFRVIETRKTIPDWHLFTMKSIHKPHLLQLSDWGIFIVSLISLFWISACEPYIPPADRTSQTITEEFLSTDSTVLVDKTVSPAGEFIMANNPLAVVTHDGVTIKLTWLYLDSTRVGFEYHVSGDPLKEYSLTFCPVRSVEVTDNLGTEYYRYVWQSQTPVTDTSLFHCIRSSDGSEYIITQNYLVTHKSDQYKAPRINLIIKIGGFDVYSKQGERISVPVIGPYLFELGGSVSKGLSIFPNLSSEIGGMGVSLDRVIVNPNVTYAWLCFNYDNRKGWYPDLEILYEGHSYAAVENEIWREGIDMEDFPTYISQFTTERCFRYSFLIPYEESMSDNAPRAMIIRLKRVDINALDALTKDDCFRTLFKIQATIPGLSFSCILDEPDPKKYSYRLKIEDMPEGMDETQAYQVITAAFTETLEGPIDFIITVPDYSDN